ncbi:uncharacterized protein LOC115623123 [Scaptodrosophila lebanonensis]|uniref:Uncharacterized protein LOC115623123 n=1 Tax=Drosophila lebanonensis TaxID=7225 RepID=A0A6J2TDX3_DROLE|nr:uncharacterized protein LOC115623123 [Scaptodrosophila lebanonensis]
MERDARNSTSTRYLVYCSYCVAALDLISAVLFAVISAVVYARHDHWTSLVALIFTIFWILIIILLLVGIWRRRLIYVRYWLFFTCLGILLDAILLLYGFTLAMSVNWEGVKITVLPFVGLAVEMTFVYVIYLFYMEIMWHEQQYHQPPPPRSRGGCDTSNMEEANPYKYMSRNERRLPKEHRERERKYKKSGKERRRQEKLELRELRRSLRRDNDSN